MILIAAVDNNWAIGFEGKLLVSIPADHRNFKRLTEGNTCIYGRKTLSTFPFEKPLANRRNIILSRKKDLEVAGAEIAGSVEEALEMVAGEDPDKVFLIGGAQVYDQMIRYCDKAVITKVDYNYQADARITDLDASDEWELVERSDEQTCYDIEYVFCKYVRKKQA
ncbi:MAG: dihydrofolate reductase [Lachnospiraceae bacterium]|nr:dihydrofolate reductase [Lachnospiraceae bacterium]